MSDVNALYNCAMNHHSGSSKAKSKAQKYYNSIKAK